MCTMPALQRNGQMLATALASASHPESDFARDRMARHLRARNRRESVCPAAEVAA
jgi:hypothetical protein